MTYITYLKSFLFAIQFNYMNPQPSQHIQPHLHNSRDFKCPCGKTYLSYPALYTHIKNKHNGNPPGPIQKPKTENKPRGRPPIPRTAIENEKAEFAKQTGDKSGSGMYKQNFENIKNYLRQIPNSEGINPEVYLEEEENQENNTIKLFQKYIDEKGDSKNQPFISIGTGLAEFFQSVLTLLPESQHSKSEHIFLLFMFFLQYAIDECHSSSIIYTEPVDELISYIHPFMNYWIQDYAEYKNVSDLWIMKKENMNKIFECFYNWLKTKQYTNYCITLI